MKLLNYIILSVVVLFTILSSSCNESLKSDDTTPPKISGIVFNMNDTIFELDDVKLARDQKKYIVLNDSTKGEGEPYIIVMGNRLTFTGTFTDDGDGLSAISVHIGKYEENARDVTKADEEEEKSDSSDSVFYDLKIVPTINMFGKSEHYVNKLMLAHTMPETGANEEGITLPISQADGYYYKVCCIDAAGNQDSIEYKSGVRILSKEAVLKLYGRLPEGGTEN